MKPQPLHDKGFNHSDLFTSEYIKQELKRLNMDWKLFKKEDVKSACKFYLRYKNNPELLLLEQEKLLRRTRAFSKVEKIDKRMYELHLDDNYGEEWCDLLLKYNEWLFKLAFKDVLGEK